MQNMKKRMDKFAHVIEIIGGIGILIMTLTVLLQVIMRYVFNSPLTWTEELARYLFIYLTFIGGGLLVYQRGHLFVEVIFNNLPDRVRKGIQIFIDAIVCGFSVYLLISAKTLMGIASGSYSTAMHIPMEYISFSVLLGAVLIILFSVCNIYEDLKNLKKDKEGSQ